VKKAKFFGLLVQALGTGSALVVMTSMLWVIFYSGLPATTKQGMVGLLVLAAWVVTVFGTIASTCVVAQWLTKLPRRVTWLEVAYGAGSLSATFWMANEVLQPVYGITSPTALKAVFGAAGMLLACTAFSCARKSE
jgi:hypothetical protein